MFIGREYELKTLNDLYSENKFQLAVVYGRRRVGKTTLLAKFIEDKPAIFFAASEASNKINLEYFSEQVLTFFNDYGIVSPFTDWETAFRYLARHSQDKSVVLVIDEFPYVAESNKSLMSMMQNAIDHSLKDTKLFMILCGSYMGFMERDVLGYKSPLFGRRTAQLKIEAFDYYDSSKFTPEYTPIDRIMAYGIWGGIPHYLDKINPGLTLYDNIAKCFLDRSSYLYDEPTAILKQELREPAMYNSIIEAIANGASKLNEIATKIGEDGNKCAKYIKTLIELGFIFKETPYGTDEKSRRTIYGINDNLFKFWYRFIFPNMSLIEKGMAEAVLEQAIKPYLETYMGHIFESVCCEFLWRQNKDGKLPFIFEKASRYWGTDNRKQSQFEIDIIAGSKDKAIFAECKWRNESMKQTIAEDLVTRADNLLFKHKYYALFSKSGFDFENKRGFLLYSPNDLF